MLLRVSLVCLLIGFGGRVEASDALLTGELGRWLETNAAPELIDTLSNHPRFKGETIRFVAMRDGKPTDNSDELTQAVQQFLTQRLLQGGNIRLAWLNHRPSCRAPRKIPYLLGLEVSRRGTRNHRMNIAMVDVEEAVWVSGIGLSWSGRLTKDERRALKIPVNEAYRGSIASPLPVSESGEIVTLLKERIACSLNGGLEGSVFVTSPGIRELKPLVLALDNELSLTPIAELTGNRSEAEWLMVATAEPVGNGSFELIIGLQPRESFDENPTGETANTQRVASVFVSGIQATTRNTSDPDKPAAVQPVPPTITHRTGSIEHHKLLSTLSMEPSARSGICNVRRARANACIEVEFALFEPAYLLVFRTNGSQVDPTSCKRHIETSDDGPRRYRLRVPPTTHPANRPDAGFYVLATKDQAIAADFSRHLRHAPGACDSSTGSLDNWVRQFQALLHEHGESVQWRAMHMRHGSAGIVTI